MGGDGIGRGNMAFACRAETATAADAGLPRRSRDAAEAGLLQRV